LFSRPVPKFCPFILLRLDNLKFPDGSKKKWIYHYSAFTAIYRVNPEYLRHGYESEWLYIWLSQRYFCRPAKCCNGITSINPQLAVLVVISGYLFKFPPKIWVIYIISGYCISANIKQCMTIFIFAMRIKPKVPDHFIRVFFYRFIFFFRHFIQRMHFYYLNIPVKISGEMFIGAKPKRSLVELFFFTENKEVNCYC